MNFDSPELQSLAERHGFSREAVVEAWNALHRGGGSMAQFSHPELGGSGQSLPGMLMIGDMFNHGLKSRVENLFDDLRNQPIAPPAPREVVQRDNRSPGAVAPVSAMAPAP